MKNIPYLSLCIPTNGIIEWVVPVLESIYSENCELSSFEVIVTDNGSDSEFEEIMRCFSDQHINFIYRKTDAKMFQNQIEAFKLANGKLIKFVNHRMLFLPGGLSYLIQFVIDNEKEKPFVYFLEKKNYEIYDSFDQFVRGMSYWSSYSGGVAMWKSDFESLDLTKPFNELFPHIDMIFSLKDKDKYIIDNHKIMKALPYDETKKGKYNLFLAFAVEYPSILLELYRNGFISIDTFKFVKRENFDFISELYFNYVVRKRECSYDLFNAKENIQVFYSLPQMYLRFIKVIMRKILNKIKVWENKE